MPYILPDIDASTKTSLSVSHISIANQWKPFEYISNPCQCSCWWRQDMRILETFFLLHVNVTKWQITSNKSSSKCSEKNSVSSLSFKTYRLIIFSFLYLILTGFGVSDKILWYYIFSEKQHCLNDWNVEQMRVKYNLYERSPS